MIRQRLERVERGCEQCLSGLSVFELTPHREASRMGHGRFAVPLSACTVSAVESYIHVSPAYTSTRSWMRSILTTLNMSRPRSSECSASTNADSARCHECSALFSRQIG